MLFLFTFFGLKRGLKSLGTLDLAKIYDILLHQGIIKFKEKNSMASLPSLIKADRAESGTKQGAIFAVRDKAHFTDKGVKGYIITSKETLLEDAAQLTHFTPNVYRTFGYSDQERKYVHGHEEKNLLQVNVFVVDIDTQKHSTQDILLACLDNSVGTPTLIVKSDRGYQVYFALDKPIFISKNRNFLSLTVAKRISDNIKKSLADVDADIYCNDFGFFRIPKHDNVVWFNANAVYSAKELIDFSQREDDNIGRQLYVVPSKLTFDSVMQSDWFHALVSATDIKGEKGQIGRNNLLFTLALVCFGEGKEAAYTYDLIDEVNSNLTHSLKGAQVRTIVNSAYSGRYKGAKKEYIETLLGLYVSCDYEVKMSRGGWYKHAKPRDQRQRSHGHEWEQDIVNFIEQTLHITNDKYVRVSQKELCLSLGIPSSTLNKVLKASTRILKRTEGRGRKAKTLLTTVTTFIKHIIKDIKEIRESYANNLKQLIAELKFESNPAVAKVVEYIEQLVASPEPDNVALLYGDSS